MANGLPIISSDIRGNRDLIDHGKGGFLFNLDDQSSLVRSIESLLNNPNLATEFSQYNLKKIKFYDKTHVNKQMENIYKNF